MEYYHLCKHIYVAQFKDQLILLDTKKDKFTICFDKLAKLLLGLIEEGQLALENTILSPTTQSCQENILIQKLININILEKNYKPYPFYIDRKFESNGASNIDWKLPLENEGITLNFSVLKALKVLLKVNFYIKIKGFYHLIILIKKIQNKQTKHIIPSDEMLKDLAKIVNKACLIYPTRTKCLEWSATFLLLALEKKWKCNLEIGVQNYPFLAHAWVECNGKVVMDSQDLRKELAIILNEPFRKLRR